MHITFEPLQGSHFPLLLEWLRALHVKKWWDQDVVYTPDLVEKKYGSYVKGFKEIDGVPKPICAFIFCVDQVPAGYIQLYNAYDFPRSKPLQGLPQSLGAFDNFIGEKNFLGQGVGSKALVEFIACHATEYAYLFADPDLQNIAAIRCYEKAGFKKVAEQKDTGEIWMLYANS